MIVKASRGTALAGEAKRQIEERASTSILDYTDGDVERVTAETIHKDAHGGDPLARRLIEHTGYYTGVGLANLNNLFNPELIAIGGGLSNIGDMLLGPPSRQTERSAFKRS